jgi:hypothetical protein
MPKEDSMGLRGNAAVVIWSDMPDAAAHDHWHSHEHLPERAGIPGFLRSRRYIEPAGAPAYFVLYEVSDAAVMTSAAYLERLNNPTAWSREVMGSNKWLNRTLCRVISTHGRGAGGHVLTIRLAPAADGEDRLRRWLSEDVLPKLAERPGLIAAHLLQRDAARARPNTVEQTLRGKPDDSIDWLVIIEGYDPAVLERLATSQLSAASFAEHGGAAGVAANSYRLAHLVEQNDMRA